MTSKRNQRLEKFQANAPPILVWKGQQQWQKPRYEVRYFHRRKVEVWSGYVRTKDVKGWVDNVRIALFVEKWKRDHAGGEPSNNDILDWMISDPYDEFHLTNLASSIIKNGVRQPIVITSEGILLDGNRRYFAASLQLREAEQEGDKATLEMVTYLPAFVLSPTCTKEDLDAVLVEENFVDDCRMAWPNFIKASKVFEAYKELRDDGVNRGPAISQLVERFGMKKAHVERWIKMMNFIEEFNDYHSAEDEETGRKPKDQYEIKWKTQKYFEYFDELSKTQVVKSLESDTEFRDKVFERLYDDDFVSFVQVRKLPAILADRRARDKFIQGTGTDAVKEAIDWVTVTGIAKKSMDVNDRIVSFKRFVETLTAQDIANLDLQVVAALGDIASTVASMAKAAKGK